MNPPVLMVLPLVVVSETSAGPLIPAGVTAVIFVAETSTTLVAAAPPIVTPVTPVKLVPKMETLVPPPIVPLDGATDVMVGSAR